MENNMTNNYQKYKAIMEALKKINVNVDTYIVIPAMELLSQLVTDRFCPRCHHKLLLSDLEQYEYVCPECDENFFEIEV